MNPTTQTQTQPQPQPPPLLPPQQQQAAQPPQPPLLLQPNRPSTSCDRHPQENFTGFCPSCLCERLAVLDPNNNNASSSSSSRKPPTSSTAAAALKAIFRPSSSTAPRGNNRPPTSTSTSFLPELRRTKSFSASKNEVYTNAFEPQRKSCDVRGRSTLYSLFSQDDERKIPKPEPPRVPDVETRNLPSSSIVQGPVNESEEDEIEEEEEEENIVVEENEDEDEIRVLEEPERERERERPNVIEERVQEIVEEEPEPKPEAEVILEEELEESLRPMKEHMDLDSQAKKSSGRDLKEIAGSFWSAASVFSKKLQKWRQKQKAKKRGGARNGAVSGSSSALLPVEKPIGRQFRETQSEIADYGFGRRSCDTDPRFSLDAARMSFDDPRYSFDEPRASWDGYLIGRTFPRMPLPTMLSVVEDAPVPVVLRTDSLIPVEDPTAVADDTGSNININIPGGSAQTKEYYSDSSSRRRKSLDRSSSIRKTAAAVVAEMDELKPVSNAAKVTPAIASAAAATDYFHHGLKLDRDLRDSNSNSNSIPNSNNSLRDDCSESFELGFRDNNAASVVGNNNVVDHRKGGSKKGSSRWSKAWSIWGFIHRRGGGNNKEEDEDRYSRGGSNCNGVERSYSESWQEFRGERNGDVRGIGAGAGGGLNRKMFRSNSSVSWRNAPSMGGSIGGSARKSDVTASNGYLGRKARDEFVLERNRSARYSPSNMDNGLLRLYLTPGGGRRNGSGKGRSNQAHSIARSVLRLY